MRRAVTLVVVLAALTAGCASPATDGDDYLLEIYMAEAFFSRIAADALGPEAVGMWERTVSAEPCVQHLPNLVLIESFLPLTTDVGFGQVRLDFNRAMSRVGGEAAYLRDSPVQSAILHAPTSNRTATISGFLVDIDERGPGVEYWPSECVAAEAVGVDVSDL